MRSGLALCGVAVMAMAVATPTPAVAQLSKKKAKRAKRYAKKAKKAYAKKRWDDAIAAFELAFEIDGDPRHLFNIGRCYEKKGQLFQAMEYVERYIDAVQDESEKEDAADLHNILRRKLLKSHGELLVTSVPDGAGVRLEPQGSVEAEERTDRTPLQTWLPAGPWTIHVEAPGYEAYEGGVVIVIGESLAKEITLREPAVEPPPEEKNVEVEPDEEVEKDVSPPPPQVQDTGGGWLHWAALGAGGALIAGGAVFGLLSAQADAEAQGFQDDPGSGRKSEVQDAIDRANSQALVANVLLGAGLVATGAGAVLWLTGDSAAIGVGATW